MSQFLYGHALNASVEKIMREAEKWLILVSPYIKLNHRYIDELKALKARPKCRILICFGKSDGQYHKSFDTDALVFLKEMPNIKIVYDERLHAKFYANENRSLLTSMNLYDYSQDNNIEVGVESVNSSILKRSGLDAESWNYFNNVIDSAQVVFDRVPKFKKAVLGIIDTYVGSETIIDEIEIPEISTSKQRSNDKKTAKKAEASSEESERIKRPFEKKFKADADANRKLGDEPPMGYCIRTGEAIPFDVMKPLSDRAFNSWIQFGDGSYPEAFCHFSGEATFGETCYDRPILRKNWRKAKKWIEPDTPF